MINIAIDGPSGAGKSTLSRYVAQKLGFVYADTGAMYRAVALHFLECGEERLDNLRLDIELHADAQHVLLNGRDVSEDIRRHEISASASAYSALPKVRAFLLERQRSLAVKQNIIMDGRDIGTVVLPNADIKIFLTADAEDRAKRRTEELRTKGQAVDYERVLEDIRRRDANDENRAAAPLRKAEDAILLDTSGNSFEQSAELLENLIRTRLAEIGAPAEGEARDAL